MKPDFKIETAASGKPGRLSIYLALSYSLLLAYGTLFPLSSWQQPASSPWFLMLQHNLDTASRSDIVTNLLIYIPLGLLLTHALLSRFRCRACSLLAATLVCALLSLLLEYLQAHLPGRVPSLADLFLNGTGGLIGALLALFIGSDASVMRRIQRLRASWIQPGRLADLGLLTLGLWVLVQLSPLVPSLDLGNLKHGLKPLWHTLLDPATLGGLRTLEYAFGFTALGVISSTLMRRRSYLLLPFATFAFMVLLLKVPILSRQLSAEAVLGLMSAFVLLALIQPLTRRIRLRLAALALFSATAAAGLYGVPGASAETVYGFNWVPFQSHLSNDLVGIVDILAGLWPFFGLSYLALLSGRTHRWLFITLGAFVVFLFVFTLEWYQQNLPGRSPDITDAILALLAWLTPWLYPPLRNSAQTPVERVDPAPAASSTVATWPRRRILFLLLIAPIAVSGIWVVLNQGPLEAALDESRQPLLPAPDQLPAVNLPNFHYPHPRLPAPSAEDVILLQQKNRRYLAQHKRQAEKIKAPLYSAILSAYVEPGSQDMERLYRRLMALKISWRGHAQAKPIALAYDWLYDQWNEPQRKGLQEKLIFNANYLIHRIREKERLSPYNVYLYNSPFQALMATAIALYREDPRGNLPMNYVYDYWKNRILPVWRQVMGNNGGWHEGGEYVGIGIGQAVYQLPAMWRKATGEDLFASEPEIRGFLNFLIYRLRPDNTHFRWGDAAHFDRRIPDRIPLALEYSDKAAYSTPKCPRPYQPTAWPWGPLSDPSMCDPQALRSRPLQQLFDGIGMVVARSDWGKRATYLTFKAGDNYWSHSHLDQGAFTLFKGVPLAIDSGLYGPGYGSDHHMNYTYQTIAHNTIVVTDPDDNTPSPPRNKSDLPRSFANDGGQRRIGSGWGIESAPLDLDEWLQKREIYHTGKIEKYFARDDLIIAVADLTPAFTNRYSGKGTFSHRTRRIEKYWRTIAYDRVNDVVVVYDFVAATDPTFVKRSLIHTIDEPKRTVGGFTTQAKASKHPTGETDRLEASILFPKDASISVIGGKGMAFLVDNKNYDEAGKVWKSVTRRKKNRPEPGLWRVEVSPNSRQKQDRFLMVLKPTTGDRDSVLQIRSLDTPKGIGSEIKGPARTLKLLFPRDREGVIVETEDKNGRKELDLSIATQKQVRTVPESRWQQIKHAFSRVIDATLSGSK